MNLSEQLLRKYITVFPGIFNKSFQLTHPLRGATSLSMEDYIAARISTHAPLARCDSDILYIASLHTLHKVYFVFLINNFSHILSKNPLFFRRTSCSFLNHYRFACYNIITPSGLYVCFAPICSMRFSQLLPK